MEAGITIIFQIIKMFAMMAVGYVLYAKAIVNDDTTARLSNILLMVATPCTIITSFNQVFSMEKLQGLGISFLLSVGSILVTIAMTHLLLRKANPVEKFSVIFSNAGFIGIPLVTGLLGAPAVFYLSTFIACFYLFVWTYGLVLMSEDKSLVTANKVLTNPCILAMVIGFIIFVLPIKPFAPIMEAVSVLGSMNTPLAMLILGAYLAKSSIFEMFKNKQAYVVSFFRLFVFPMVILLLLRFVPQQYLEIKTIILVASSAPVGVMVAVFAQRFHRDFNYGAQIVSLSTILCLISIPTLLLISEMIW